MKKFGFTLAELLVSLGIISVVAALTAPFISNTLPDKNKIAVIKAYKTIAEINENILTDPSLYILGSTYGTNTCTTIMRCWALPDNPDYSDTTKYQGPVKYQYLLLSKLNITGDEPVMNSGSLSFTTTDGLDWTIARDNNGTEYTITIDTDENGNDCSYNSQTCTKPDKFIFKVNSDKNGLVEAGDNLTKVYLENPTKFNDKNADLKAAEKLSSAK